MGEHHTPGDLAALDGAHHASSSVAKWLTVLGHSADDVLHGVGTLLRNHRAVKIVDRGPADGSCREMPSSSAPPPTCAGR
ncbi:MAG TPA: hypothetical protein VFP65_18445 [Anaeromyxobacteraceae bacterium]|nr:hypothetical protein [Anaeromyxobacteraceae bacterium]